MTKLGVVFAIVLALGCSKSNPNYCENAPDHNCSLGDGGGDAPQGCNLPGDCTNPAAPLCDLSKRQCVACESGNVGACSNATPVCNVPTETCRKCQTHDECGAPGACLTDGSCGTDANVAWVMAGGSDTGTCTQAMPCATITQALAQGRAYVKVGAGTINDHVTVAASTTILADSGAMLVSTGAPGITVSAPGAVAIHDLRITGSTFGVYVPTIDGPTLMLDHVIIDGNGTGLNVSGNGKLTMSRCVVSGNTGGGAAIVGSFDITNSIFVANGGAASTNGGLTITAGSGSQFRFNTVANNQASSGTTRGIICVNAFAMTSNIVANNDVSPNCSFDYSLFDTGTATAHNKVGDPMFENTAPSDPTANNYFRINPTSPAIDSADSAASVDIDIDDHMRPMGSGYDIGASEN